MNIYNWIKNIKLEDCPNLDNFCAMWADGASKYPKSFPPKSKHDYIHFKDLSKKFPYIIKEAFNVYGYSSYLEIGVAYGGGLRLVLNYAPHAKVYAIDPISDLDIKKNFDSRKGQGRHGYDGSIFQDPRVKMFMTRSDDINTVSYFKNNHMKSIDFINIDGDHSYLGAISDLRNYSDLLSDFGLIWLDDAGTHKEVEMALADFLKERTEFEVWDWNGKCSMFNKSGIDGVFLLRKK